MTRKSEILDSEHALGRSSEPISYVPAGVREACRISMDCEATFLSGNYAPGPGWVRTLECNITPSPGLI